MTISSPDFDPDSVQLLVGKEGEPLSNVVDDPNYHLDRLTGQITYRAQGLKSPASYIVEVLVRDFVGNETNLRWTFTFAESLSYKTPPAIVIGFPPKDGVTGLTERAFSSSSSTVFLFRYGDPRRPVLPRLIAKGERFAFLSVVSFPHWRRKEIDSSLTPYSWMP